MIGQNIAQAAALLKQGEVIAIPTETVYGLAGNALDEKAVWVLLQPLPPLVQAAVVAVV